MLIKFKIFFKSLYKNFIIFIFKFIYPTPSLQKKNQKDLSYKVFRININKNKYYLYEIKKGVVFTNSNDVTAYISKNNFLTEASLQFRKFDQINSKNAALRFNETLLHGTPKVRKKFEGKILSLLSGGASKDNFTHWFTDVIPRIEIFSKKFNLKKIDKFYIPSFKYKFQKESLKILGIKPNKIISSDKVKHISAEYIYATSHPCFNLPTKVKKWSLDYLNKNFKASNNKKKYKKIFIDRDQFKLIDKKNLKKFKNYRILLNENEIKKYLTSKGFEIIKPEKFSLKDQIYIFSNAKTIIGLYGASMMMLAFCKKKTNIIEIKPILGGNEFKNISRLKKLNHKQINLKPLFKSSTPQNGLLICPIKKIENTIKLFKN